MKSSALLAALALALAACGGGDGSKPAADASVDAYVPPALTTKFPDTFLWGTATASYQVEKGLTNTDWHQWEVKGKVLDGDKDGMNDRAEDGPDFQAHYADDLDRAKSLGNNAYRMEISLARLFPTRAQFPNNPDPTVLAYYHAVLKACKDRQIQPLVTLFHWALPTWLHDLDDPTKAGWEAADMANTFAAYARWAGREFGAEVDLWITINEPLVYVTTGWLSANAPPGKFLQVDAALDVGWNLIEGHARAYDALHQADIMDADGDGKPALVSIASHNRVFVPETSDPQDKRAAELLQRLSNRMFLDAVVKGDEDKNFNGSLDDPGDKKADPMLKNRLDYIGLNYYGNSTVRYIGNENSFPIIGLPKTENLDTPYAKTENNWDVYPHGLRDVLDELKPYALPIIITENGIADRDDDMRPRYIVEHLYEVQRAIADGIDVRGYMYWSLMDNFEWSAGYCPRFGLYHVDFTKPDRPRTEGAGARTYRQIIAAKDVSPELFRTLPAYPIQDYSVSCPHLSPF